MSIDSLRPPTQTVLSMLTVLVFLFIAPSQGWCQESPAVGDVESSPPTEESSNAPARPLLDGDTLNGWSNPYDWGQVQVVDGEVRLTADKKFFLVTEEVFHDYEFEGELKLPEGKSNSGFMARGQVKPNKVYGYQAEADPTDRRWSGGLYDESRRQWLHPLWRDSNAQAAFDRDRWNRYRIRCVGNHLQFFVNDVLTTDYFDPADLSGRIGLQHHGEKGQTYRFRNLEVRNLGRHAWQPLMKANASGIASLDGWNTVGGGTWEIVDGILQGRASSEANEPNGLLFSEATYGDFTIRFQYRFVQGDSGFFFRSQILDDKPYVRGVQCEIDGTEDVAGLYQTGGKGWLVRPLHYLDRFPEDRHAVVRNRWRQAKQGIPLEQQDPRSKTDTASDLEPNPWNSMVVSVSGKRIVTHLNGCLASDTVVDDLAESGVIAFQLHGQQDLEVDFRKIEILLPTDP